MLLKRVPLDFSWELNKIWSGYQNPHPIHECKDCHESRGYSQAYIRYENLWYRTEHNWKPNPYNKNARYDADSWRNNITQDDVDALLEADRLWNFTRIPLTDEHREILRLKKLAGENSWLPFDNGYRPTAEEVNLWNLKGPFGHDGINCTVIIKARLKKDNKSHLCPTCKGSGMNWQHPKAEELWENWEPYEPPVGDGFQIWDPSGYGCPITPVFESDNLLYEWCDENLKGYQKKFSTDLLIAYV